MKKKIIVFVVIILGFLMMLYPFYSNFLFEIRSDSIVESYESGQYEDADKERLLEEARRYNEQLSTGQIRLHDPFTEQDLKSQENYNRLLRKNSEDMMGTILIPTIDVKLPIFPGTSTEVLEKGVGHLEGTSLPIGGEGTHCVLTGHTGLSNAKLFTDLVQLEQGDIFIINVLGDKIAYKVSDIYVVEPEDLSYLYIEPDRDLCTLITCTPYGINSHRLLVRGERTEYNPEDAVVSQSLSDRINSKWQAEYFKSLVVGFMIILILYVLAVRRQRKMERGDR